MVNTNVKHILINRSLSVYLFYLFQMFMYVNVKIYFIKRINNMPCCVLVF